VILNEVIENTRRIAAELDVPEAIRLVTAAEKTLNRQKFHLTVLGEFKRGKSSLVNSLISRNILPTDILPSTAVLTVIEHSEAESCHVTWCDGHTDNWPATQEALNRLTVEGDVEAESVQYVKLTLNLPLLQDGIVLIDTPGVNDLSDARAEVTYNILPHSDAALFLLDAAAPLTRSEANFLTAKVLTHKLDSLLFILSKADRLNEEEREQALKGARARVKEVLGMEMPVFPYSANYAFDAEQRGEVDSGYVALLKRITELREGAKQSKIHRATATLQLAVGELLAKIAMQESLRDVEEDQLRRLKDDLEARESHQQIAFARLKESVNLVGRDTLSEMMEKSLGYFFTDLHRELDNQLKLQSQNVDRFWNGTLQITLERQLRQYMERKSAEIQTFLDRFVSHTAKEYRKHFDEPLRAGMIRNGIEMPDWRGEVSTDDSADRKHIIQQSAYLLGGAAVGLAASVLLPVVPVVVLAMGGTALGRITSVEVGKQKNRLKREQYQQMFEKLMYNLRRELQIDIRKRINEWFDRFLENLDTHRQQRLESLRHNLEANLSDSRNESLPSTVTLSEWRQKLETILANQNNVEA